MNFIWNSFDTHTHARAHTHTCNPGPVIGTAADTITLDKECILIRPRRIHSSAHSVQVTDAGMPKDKCAARHVA